MSTEATDKKSEFKDFTDDVKEYLNLRIQIIRLNLTQKVSTTLATLISSGAVIIFIVLFFLFGSFALSYWLGVVFKNTALGFLLVAGFYLLLGIIIYLLNDKSIKPGLINKFIKDFSNDDNDDDTINSES